VLATWQGLGYPRRARNLWRTAAIITEHHDGRVPADLEHLLALPGVGPYTARAVHAFAFGIDTGVVDTNVGRILARWTGRRLAPAEAQRIADELVPAGESWAWNQALMELGATVCTPAVPRCGRCPVREFCWSRVAGRQTEFPERPPRPPAVSVRLAVAVVRDPEGRILVFRRDESPMRGLYELPCGEYRSDESAETALVRETTSRYGIRLEPLRELAGFRHTVMNRRIAVVPFEADLVQPAPGGIVPGGRFVYPRDLDRVPSGSMLRKALERVGGTRRAPADSVPRLLVSAPDDP